MVYGLAGGGNSPSFLVLSSALFLSRTASTTTYSDSDPYSPSLAPGVGGKAPGMGGVLYVVLFCTSGRCAPESSIDPTANSVARGLLGNSVCVGDLLKVSPFREARCRGLVEEFEREGIGEIPPAACLAFRRSSVAFNRASRASSSEVWEETAFFLDLGERVRESLKGWCLYGGEGLTFLKLRHPSRRRCCRF